MDLADDSRPDGVVFESCVGSLVVPNDVCHWSFVPDMDSCLRSSRSGRSQNSRMVHQQQQQAVASSPDVMGILGNFLDSNKDGSVMDDVGRLAGKFFR